MSDFPDDNSFFGTLKFTQVGGVAVQYFNQTGEVSVRGTCVTITAPWTVGKVPIDVPSCIGVIDEDGKAIGAKVWVVIYGIAPVLFTTSVTAGYLARTPLTGDGGAISGRAISEPLPASPFASDKHFCEIGHCVETGPAGLVNVNLHFN